MRSGATRFPASSWAGLACTAARPPALIFDDGSVRTTLNRPKEAATDEPLECSQLAVGPGEPLEKVGFPAFFYGEKLTTTTSIMPPLGFRRRPEPGPKAARDPFLANVASDSLLLLLGESQCELRAGGSQPFPAPIDSPPSFSPATARRWASRRTLASMESVLPA